MDKAEEEIEIAKSNSTNLCEEHKDCKAYWQKYQEEQLMSYLYICVRDLIDQPPDNEHKLNRFIEIGKYYDMSQENV